MMDFLSGGFGFIMSLYETLEVPLCDIFHIQAFFPLSDRMFVFCLRFEMVDVFTNCRARTFSFYFMTDIFIICNVFMNLAHIQEARLYI